MGRQRIGSGVRCSWVHGNLIVGMSTDVFGRGGRGSSGGSEDPEKLTAAVASLASVAWLRLAVVSGSGGRRRAANDECIELQLIWGESGGGVEGKVKGHRDYHTSVVAVIP